VPKLHHVFFVDVFTGTDLMPLQDIHFWTLTLFVRYALLLAGSRFKLC
jgi:hypothetical protein